jgi:hypothetical protein
VRRLIRCFLIPAVVLMAQAPAPEVSRAEEEVRRVQALVEAGVAPRLALTKAQNELQEAQDLGVLRATLYGQIAVEDLSEQQAEAMLAAAQRNWSRKQQKLEDAKKLVDAGVLARTGLTPYLLEMDESRRVHDLALSRGRLVRELAEIALSEDEVAAQLEETPHGPSPLIQRFDGDGVFHTNHLRMAVLEYEKEFGKSLPISARGETALHRSLGYDHRGRVDVALSPDTREGQWLRQFLQTQRVPFYAFRGAVAGKSTAAHFHLGPPSLRLRRAD